jgi:hypothetical protein
MTSIDYESLTDVERLIVVHPSTENDTWNVLCVLPFGIARLGSQIKWEAAVEIASRETTQHKCDLLLLPKGVAEKVLKGVWQ